MCNKMIQSTEHKSQQCRRVEKLSCALCAKGPCGFELELELIQSQLAQKPMLRGEVGARALLVRSVSREQVWASAGVQGAWVSGCECEAD